MFGLNLFRVVGHSMFPDYRDGNIVLSRRVTKLKSTKVGDAVVVDHPSLGRIIKRIRSISESGELALVGNNQMSTAQAQIGQVSFDRVVGKVIYAFR